MFTKIYKYYTNVNSLLEKKNDMTITYNFLYYHILLKNERIGNIIKDKKAYIELITIYHKDRIFQSNPVSGSIQSIDMNSPEIINYIETLLNNELIFYEFCEVIFIISKKYFALYTKKNENYQEVLDQLSQTIEENVNKELGVNNYSYPKLKAHIQIEKMRQEELDRKLEEERREKERQRYEKERKNFKEEDSNVYKEEEKSKSDSFSDYN